MSLEFKFVTSKGSFIQKGTNLTCYLLRDNWDDFGFKTLFHITVLDEEGVEHDLGSVKIGCIGQKENESTRLDEFFRQIDGNYFSLGQGPEYYKAIEKFTPELKKKILIGLNDVVFNESILKKVMNEDVFNTSLLRDVSLSSVKGQFSRLLDGAEPLTKYQFKYVLPKGKKGSEVVVDFTVVPDSNPPTNVHVLVGRNGVGKTYLLNNMIKTLVDDEESKSQIGKFTHYSNSFLDPDDELFAGVVSVAFSAFDPFEPYPEKKDKSEGLRYSYVGLKRTTNRGGKKGTPMSYEMLTNEFVHSLKACVALGKIDRLVFALEKLESDPLFKDINLYNIISEKDPKKLDSSAKSLFKELSSGHAVVLLTITKLIEKVEEKTLVLMDEPEGHLHPPLLSAFIRALSELLTFRNGVAIIATHSPVVVQEVPKNCVWKLWRSDAEIRVERPEIETFGENIGVLNREIFGLEVTESGFHKLLLKVIEEENSYEAVLSVFNNELGNEAKGIVRGLLALKTNEDNVQS